MALLLTLPKGGTCNGTVTEPLFNLVPVEFVLMLVFAQWHFAVSLFLTIVVLVGEIALFRLFRKDERKHKFSRKRHRKYQFAFIRCSVLGIAFICAIPCILSVFYGFEAPTYKATEELWNQLFSEKKIAEDTEEQDDPYKNNTELWDYLQEKNWDRLSIRERITVTQKLVDFESDVLGVPSIPVTAAMIGYSTLGAYDNETNQIWINTEHLANSPVRDVVNSACHEVHHSYVNYLVKTLDWNNPAMTSAYFTELRELMDSQENYKSASVYDFSEYKNQPLEVAAREYAEEETAKIMTYIDDGG